jgi:hypothetical protein
LKKGFEEVILYEFLVGSSIGLKLGSFEPIQLLQKPNIDGKTIVVCNQIKIVIRR